MKWISVKDKLPELGEKVLVYTTGNNMYTGWINSENTFTVVSGSHGFVDSYTVTHWMPLPEPPQEKTKPEFDKYEVYYF